MSLFDPAFWFGLGSLVVANLLLSGDNAIVIALASRGLPPRVQRKAVFYGSAAAIVLRILLTLLASEALALPYLRIAGGALLLWIGIGLIREPGDDEGPAIAQHGDLARAVRTIVVADLVMSLDNVVAVAAAARGDAWLLGIGLAISIPIIVFGSAIVLSVVSRFPIIVFAGAAFLGWLAGGLAHADPALAHRDGGLPAVAFGLAGAALVLAVGLLLRRRAALSDQTA